MPLNALDVRKIDHVRLVDARKLSGRQLFLEASKCLLGKYFAGYGVKAAIVAHAFDVDNFGKPHLDQARLGFDENKIGC